MDQGALEQARAERLIATGRLLLAFFSLTVVLVDTDLAVSGTIRLRPVALAFVAYAGTLAALAWRAPTVTANVRLALHVVDFLLFAVLIELTRASVSPFFIFFIFSLLSALLRFSVRGMVMTAAAALGTYAALVLLQPDFRSEVGYLIMRLATLVVATVLLSYVGAYQERLRRELTKLAAWPRGMTGERNELVRETLVLARDLLASPRALLVWEEEEEPWVWIALLGGDSFTIARDSPNALDELLLAPFRSATFLCRADGSDPVVVSAGVATPVAESPMTAAAKARFEIGDAVSAHVSGEAVSGRIFFLDRPAMRVDDCAVAEIISRLVATRLDQLNIATRVRSAAVGEERLRVARDLHDGLLQSLTAASLQLELTRRLIDRDPAAARERLENVQELIASDQRELRAFITNLRPEGPEARSTLGERLREIAERVRKQWDVEVSMRLDPAAAELSDDLAAEIYAIANEGMANAAKHARASRIEVDIVLRGRDVEVSITDDGVGFPFTGEFTRQELDRLDSGPVTLKERVAALGGDMRLRSGRSGSRIDIRIARSAATLPA